MLWLPQRDRKINRLAVGLRIAASRAQGGNKACARNRATQSLTKADARGSGLQTGAGSPCGHLMNDRVYIPIPRVTRRSLYGPEGEVATRLGPTWLESESFAYPAGGFTRRAYVRLPDKTLRLVKVSIPDTFSTIPARLHRQGQYVKGYVVVSDGEFKFRCRRALLHGAPRARHRVRSRGENQT